MPDRALSETRFARTPGGSSIAYQCVGEGDVSIVSVPPMAPGHVAAVCAQHGIEVLGPPPPPLD